MIEFVLTHSGYGWSPLSDSLRLNYDVNNGSGFVEVDDYSVTKLTDTTYKFSFTGNSNYHIRVEIVDAAYGVQFDNWLAPS